MNLNRRRFLALAGAAALAPKLVVAHQHTNQGIRKIRLIAREENRTMLDENTSTRLWGYSENELRLVQGQPVEIEFVNELSEPSSVHWHGLRIDNAMDGVTGLTQDPVQPGETFVYKFTPQDAGTFWAHTHHRTYEQLARGLYLPLIIEEPTTPNYDRELVMMFDDWRVKQDGQIDLDSFEDMHDWSHSGRLGNVLTVNKQLEPQLEALAGERVRLRLINAANARVMTIRVPLPGWIVAKDGQPLTDVAPLTGSLRIAPAERYDLLVDIPNEAGAILPFGFEYQGQFYEIAQIQVAESASESTARDEPTPLPANPIYMPSKEPELQLKLEMQGGAMRWLSEATYKGERLSGRELMQRQQAWALNGIANMADEPMFDVASGTLVEIELINSTAWEHAMHFHGHHFQSDSANYPASTWHDTLLMAPQERVSIRMPADNLGKWLIHCHMIEHQMAGMKTWFTVS